MTSQAAAARGGVEARRRLVQEDDVGIADQRQRDVEASPLSAGEVVRERVGLLGQSDERDRVVDIAGRPVVTGVQLQALADRQARLGFGFLQHNPDTVPPRRVAVRRVDAENPHLTVGALPKPFQNLHRRRLPRAVRTQEREDLAAPHVEIHARTASRRP